MLRVIATYHPRIVYWDRWAKMTERERESGAGKKEPPPPSPKSDVTKNLVSFLAPLHRFSMHSFMLVKK